MKFVPFLYAPSFHDRVSYAKSLTREYDITAVKYLAASAIPLLIGYSFWSLKYRVHKSWYSWILRSLVGFVYTFGFISMTPQLFINYKLKSVAHMPWKAFTYKALNTFIDDLFAFVIKMPWLHRIACFRDGKGSFKHLLSNTSVLDVLFVIYLYQMWIYPVDIKRSNEFGQVFEAEKAESSEEKKDEDKESASDAGQTQARKRIIKTEL